MSLFRRKPIETDLAKDTGLKRVLTAFDLTLLGVGAIIGAGIFVLTGRAAAVEAGPAITLAFVVAGIACTCAALAYAELASTVGGCGSAYAYGYAGLGEFPAWIIACLLILEYTVAISTVAVGWSGYFNAGLLGLFGVGFPTELLHGPGEGGLVNLPALAIVALLGVLLATGAKVSAQFNAIMVFVKVGAILLFLLAAFGHIDAANWVPYIPERVVGSDGVGHFGVVGIFTAASLVFFAYIGFDAVSTAAEECRNPQRDLPIGIIASLAVCTVFYMLVSAVLTGIVPYTELNTASPVATALLKIGRDSIAGWISLGAIAGLTTVMLVLYYAITRILFAVSRDGLLPPFFSHISARTRSPIRVIVLIGVIMCALAGFLPLNRLAELTNIGTLGAFVVVCAGVLVIRRTHPHSEAGLPHARRPGDTGPRYGVLRDADDLPERPHVVLFLRRAGRRGAGLLPVLAQSQHARGGDELSHRCARHLDARSTVSPMGAELEGRTALVTGGGRGLGRAIALHLARAGAGIAVVARTRSQLDESAAMIESEGGRALAIVADVTERSEVEAGVAETERELGPISILVNNAGLARPYGPVGHVDPDDWWRSHAIHVRGTLLFMSAVLPGMRARRAGRIINIASKGGIVVAPNLSSYCVAKATVIRLTEHVDAEAKADGVRAFVVQPGTIATDMGRESLSNPEARRWVPFLVSDLERVIDRDPTDDLARLGAQIVSLAAGHHDKLAGSYLDLEELAVG